MSTANRKSDDYKAMTFPGRARRERLYRAGLAAVLMLLLVIGLMIYDRDEPPAPPPIAEQDGPQPLTPPSVQSLEPPALLLMRDQARVSMPDAAGPDAAPDEPAADDSEAPRDPPVADDGSPLHDATGSDAVEPEEVASAIASPPAGNGGDETATAPTAEPREVEVAVASPGPSTGPPAATASGAARFQIHLGDFASVAAAHALHDELLQQDYASRVQTRVAVGPFASRKAAEGALARLRRERAMRGVIIAAPADSGFIVQVGVFVIPTNADKLRSELVKADYPVQAHARVVLGPYATRNAADAVRVALRDGRGVAAEVVALP